MGHADPTRPHVADLGPLHIEVDGTPLQVRGRRACTLLARLLVAGAAGLGSDDLIDAIWPSSSRPSTAKQSLTNAVAQLRKSAGHELIETTSTGYRLGPTVTSDRRILLDGVASAEETLDHDASVSLELVESALIGWRGEPWVDLEADWVLDADRRRLRLVHQRAEAVRSRGLLRLGRHAEAAENLGLLVDQSPFDEQLWNDLARSLGALGRRTEALRTLARARATLRTAGLEPGSMLLATEQRLVDDGSIPPVPGMTLASAGDPRQTNALQRTLMLWEHDRRDDALDELHRGADELEPDDVRRLDRWIRTVDTTNGWARCLWRDLVSLRDRLPGRAERTLISMDAFALEQADTGIATADAEVDAADTVEARVRALRVRFMAGAGRPVDARLVAVVDHLGSIDSDEATIEAARFRAVLAAKAGRFGEAAGHLAHYDELVTSLRPEWLDDFAQLSNVVLSLCGVANAENVGNTNDLFPVLYNMYTVELVRVWGRLSIAEPLDRHTASLVDAVAATVPPDTAAALRACAAWRTNDEETPALMDALAEAMTKTHDHRYIQIVPVVLGLYAVSTGDRQLASRVADRVETWRGEQLGLWPLDLICGSANALLDELAAI